MDTETINRHYLDLLRTFGIDAQIITAEDPALPKQEIVEHNNRFTIRLNPYKILPDVSYESYAASNARKLLLPRLVLETERLILRRFRMEDAAGCYAFLSDPVGCYFNGFEAFHDMDAEYARLMELFESQLYRYVICRKDTGEVVGMLNLLDDNSRAVEAMELGYNISPEYRRQGFAFEALSAVIQLLQRELKLDLLLAGVMGDNDPSRNLLLKLGFREEGRRRKAMWHDSLGPVDLLYYYLDRP